MRSSTQADSAETQQKLQDVESESALSAARYAAVHVLMDSLLHDARNPLNALSINLEVLAERLRRQAEQLAPAFDKNLRVMREQIQRVDGILKSFADFISPRSGSGAETDFSAVVLKAIDVLGHECRKRRVSVRPMVDAGVKVALTDASAASFFALQPLFRAIRRSNEGEEISITLKQEAGYAVLRVLDAGSAGEDDATNAHIAHVLSQLADEQHGRAEVRAGECLVHLKLA